MTTERILQLVLDHASAIQARNLHKSKQAYAAIREALEVSKGWRMVPREATPEIVATGVYALRVTSEGDFDADEDEIRDVYRAMIEAAPEQPK